MEYILLLAFLMIDVVPSATIAITVKDTITYGHLSRQKNALMLFSKENLYYQIWKVIS